MKTYKIKSLIYFSGFLLAAILYYGIEKQAAFEEQLQSNEVVETVSDDFNETEEDFVTTVAE